MSCYAYCNFSADIGCTWDTYTWTALWQHFDKTLGGLPTLSLRSWSKLWKHLLHLVQAGPHVFFWLVQPGRLHLVPRTLGYSFSFSCARTWCMLPLLVMRACEHVIWWQSKTISETVAVSKCFELSRSAYLLSHIFRCVTDSAFWAASAVMMRLIAHATFLIHCKQ